MIHRTPSKLAMFGIATWWTLIVLEPGNAFRNPSFDMMMELCRSEWTVAAITGSLAVLMMLDLLNRSRSRIVEFTWGASMVWWFFVAICIASQRLLATGTGAYLTFAFLGAATWWQRKSEAQSG